MKNIKKISLVLALIIISGLLSCGTDDNPIISPIEFTIDDFPHEVSTVWQYQLGPDKSNYTRYMRVDGTTYISNDSLFVYVIIADNKDNDVINTDTTYWHIAGDTVTYYINDNGNYKEVLKLIFPLQVGDEWQSSDTPGYSYFVQDISSKTVSNTNYQKVVHINALENNPTEFSKIDVWFAPNIGLIYSEYVEDFHIEPTIINENWSLVGFYEPDSFELSDFPLQVNAAWNYKVYNNRSLCINCYDSVTVTIIDSNFVSHGVITENWQFDYPNQEKISETILEINKLFIQWHHYSVYFKIEFPLTVGENFNNYTSSIQVLGKETVTTDAGTFKDAYYLKGYTIDGFEPGTTIDLWIAKGYGIVKLHHIGPPMGSNEDKTWELKYYEPNSPVDSFTVDKFPNYNGVSRTYEVYHQLTGIYDTFYVDVAESLTVATWTYTHDDSTWQEIVSVEGSVAKYFYPDDMINPFKTFQFPIKLGDRWTTYPLINISEVTSISPLLIFSVRYFPCYAVKTDYTSNSAGILYEIEWLSPEIGLVQKTVVYAFPRTSETWRLIDY